MHFMESRLQKFSLIQLQEHGIRSLVFSGLQLPGLPQAYTLALQLAVVEPKGQRLGVNILFGALLVVVLGSMAGEWLSVMNLMPDKTGFYLATAVMNILTLEDFSRLHY